MKRTKILISGHGQDRDALDASRRTAAHSKLILLTSAPNAPDIAQLQETETPAGVTVEVHAVDPLDLLACLETARSVLLREKGHDIRIHVAGGPNLVTSALLLAAFQHGIDAFYCHDRGISILPVVVNTQLDERFARSERLVLTRLPTSGEVPIAGLAGADLTLPTVKTALLRLRKLGLVTANAQTAGLTPAGAYYQIHLGPAATRAAP